MVMEIRLIWAEGRGVFVKTDKKTVYRERLDNSFGGAKTVY